VSLSGNLGFVSLDEVLRMLNRSKQRGAVEVRGANTGGRVFFDRGMVSLATMLSDEQLHTHLAKSGHTGVDPDAITALLREMTVETIHQLGLHGKSFDVIEEEASPYPNDRPFDLEDLLVDAKQRLTDWAEVSTVVSDLDAPIRFCRDLGDRDRVTIEKDSWRLLSEIGQGASVTTLAGELGTTEFWVARVVAGMIEDDLLTVPPVPTEEIEEQSVTWEEPPATWDEVDAEATVSAGDSGHPLFAGDEPPGDEPEPAPDETEHLEAEPVSNVVDPNQSWWTEPQSEVPGEPDEEAEAEPAAGPVAVASDTGAVEEDTEAFLEKVFSELEPTEPSDGGYGLLRRRRMGTLRDVSNDD
jgi:hypothetical protein